MTDSKAETIDKLLWLCAISEGKDQGTRVLPHRRMLGAEVNLVDVASIQKVADIIDAAKLLAVALEVVEWISFRHDDDLRCPSCKWYYNDGHADDCDVQSALAVWKDVMEDTTQGGTQ